MIEKLSPEIGAGIVSKFAADLPEKPGVYRMLDKDKRVLYIGKAKRLKRRVLSYARDIHRHQKRILTMVSQVASVEVIHTRTEVEALLLEMQLIKSQKPRYNILLRDDKSFPYVLVRKDHDFPQILLTRERIRTRGTYHGPFGSGVAARDTLDQLQKAFLIRSCSDHTLANRDRPCLLYQIKRCCAPCVDKISKEDYQKLVQECHQIIKGKSHVIVEELSEKMQAASAALQFEEAARLRDRIAALGVMKRDGASANRHIEDVDVITLIQQNQKTCVNVFFYRKGFAHGSRSFFPRTEEQTDQGQIMLHVIGQLYTKELPPPQIFVNLLPEEQYTLEQALSRQREKKVKIVCPMRGKNKDLVAQSLHATKEALLAHLSEHESALQQFEALGKLFNMPKPPQVVEIYDNSHLQGSHALGAMVVATPEGFQKNRYRKYNMPEDMDKRDDIAMMHHMVTRRFSSLKKTSPEENPELWPDILIIDGGKNQLHAAMKALDALGIDNVSLMGIAKGENRRSGEETLFIAGDHTAKKLEKNDPLFFLLQKLRDESHRFVINAHRKKRHKAIQQNLLDTIPGIGAKRKKLLMQHFGSAKAVMTASKEDLEKIEGISSALAQTITDHAS